MLLNQLKLGFCHHHKNADYYKWYCTTYKGDMLMIFSNLVIKINWTKAATKK